MLAQDPAPERAGDHPQQQCQAAVDPPRAPAAGTRRRRREPGRGRGRTRRLLAAAKPLRLAALGAALSGSPRGSRLRPRSPALRSRGPTPRRRGRLRQRRRGVVTLVGTPLVGLTFSLPGDGRLGFALVGACWLVALALLPSARQLGVARQ